MMQRLLLIFLFTLLAQVSKSEKRTWTNESGDSDWQNDANWEIEGDVNAGITYIFDSPVINNTVNNFPAQLNIEALNIKNGAQVVFFNEVAVNMNITGVGLNFLINAGSLLIINGDLNFIITLSSGTRGQISGNLSFNEKSSSANHKLFGNDAGSVEFLSKSSLTQNCNGNIFGDKGTNNVVIFKPGSSFIQNNGANPFGKDQPESKVVFENGSNYKFKTSNDPSFKGRKYGNFIFDINRELTLDNIISQNIETEMQSLTILKGSIIIIKPTNYIDFKITENLVIESEASLDFENSLLGSSTFSFNGTTNQSISGEASFGTLEVNNPKGLTVNSAITIYKGINFTNGRIESSSAPITLETDVTNSTILGASSTRYISGQVIKKFGSAVSFTFPIGNSDHWGFVNIEPTVASSITVSCSTDETPNHMEFSDPLRIVSKAEYWTILSNSNTDIKVGLHYGTHSGVIDPSTLSVAKWDGAQWNGLTSVSNAGIVSSTDFTSISANPNQLFTIGSSDVSSLPVVFNSFTASNNNALTHLTWTTSDESNNKGFEVQKSYNAIDFSDIGFVSASDKKADINNYSFIDYASGSSAYYRLKQVDFNGNFEFSKVLFVKNASVQSYITPNPGNTDFQLVLNEGHTGMLSTQIYNTYGLSIGSFQGNFEAANIFINNCLHSKPSGIYFISISLGSSIEKIKVVKD